MKKVLVISYSQTGQTQRALESFAQGFPADFSVDFKKFETKEKFTFPWKMNSFFRVFPRCVRGLAPEIEPISIEWNKYDLVIFGYQVWFLSPSLPAQAFLNSPVAQGLQDKKVITIVTCRNLWQSAFKIVRRKLLSLEANFLGQITLCETGPVWASFVTTPRWMLTGKKEAFSIFPAAGIPEDEFNPLRNKAAQLAQNLSSEGSPAANTLEQIFGCNLNRVSLTLMDRIGRGFFLVWSALILKLAPKQGLFQDFLLLLFRLNLILLIVSIGPCTKIFEVLVGNNPKYQSY